MLLGTFQALAHLPFYKCRGPPPLGGSLTLPSSPSPSFAPHSRSDLRLRLGKHAGWVLFSFYFLKLRNVKIKTSGFAPLCFAGCTNTAGSLVPTLYPRRHHSSRVSYLGHGWRQKSPWRRPKSLGQAAFSFGRGSWLIPTKVSHKCPIGT